MTDPVSADVASQAVESAVGREEVESSSAAPDFSETMEQADGGPDGAEGVGDASAVEGPDEVEPVEAAAEIPTDDFIQGLLEEEANIEQMMEDCLNGAEMGQEEMLQMQAVIYSYSQRVELTTKVVDNATSGVKEVMNTQV